MAVRHHRICRITLIKSKNFLTSCNHYRMIMFRSAFCDHQIIIIPDMIQMRSFRRASDTQRTVEDRHRFSCHTELFHIVFGKPDSALFYTGSIIPYITCSHNICLSVIVKENRCIDSRYVGQPMWFRPRTCRIFCGNDIISFVTEIRIDNIEQSVMIPKCRRHHAAYQGVLLHMKSIFHRHRISDLLPMSQIFTVEDRDSRTHLKTGTCQIKIISYSADCRIRIISRNDRIFQFLFHCKSLLFCSFFFLNK